MHEPDLEINESVLGRRSYIDDILVTGRSWDSLCEKAEKLLDACDDWNLSISVAKSFWGQKVDYLGHRVSAGGLETHPNDLSALQELPFPTNLRSMQSFLGSLNYYSRFIEDFAIYASVLYELREADFYEIARSTKSTGDDENVAAEEGAEARTALTTLKNKIVNAPIVQHFDVDRQPVVVVYASKWAISAALMQEHDGVYKPVTFTSRTLKPNEINYGMVDKEVLALLRILDICYTQLATRSIKVLTRHSTLVWLLHSSGLQGRLGRWAALLSSWTLEIVKCTKGEDEILGVTAVSITSRKDVDSILISIAPRKQPRQVISMPPPTVEPSERLLVVSFDGSARVKRSGGAYSEIVWSDRSVNEAEGRDAGDTLIDYHDE
ncbi:LOW QUALITY PROTEIN: Reverse transcriptase, partial [Phytophthora palmivora]